MKNKKSRQEIIEKQYCIHNALHGQYLEMEYRTFIKMVGIYDGETGNYEYPLDEIGYVFISSDGSVARWYTQEHFRYYFKRNDGCRMTFGDALNALLSGASVSRMGLYEHTGRIFFLYDPSTFPAGIKYQYDGHDFIDSDSDPGKPASRLSSKVIMRVDEIYWSISDWRPNGDDLMSDDWIIVDANFDYRSLNRYIEEGKVHKKKSLQYKDISSFCNSISPLNVYPYRFPDIKDKIEMKNEGL